jgi:hypothetical protein
MDRDVALGLPVSVQAAIGPNGADAPIALLAAPKGFGQRYHEPIFEPF